MSQPILYIFSGLPCSGKSTLANKLAKHTNSTYLRIDTIEQGLRDLCNVNVEGEGYRLSYRIANDNLCAGNDVIADSVNPIQLTRDEWNQVALNANAKYINIEIECSDKIEHKKRSETRENGMKSLENPKWEQICKREYHPWNASCVKIDTAKKTIEESFKELLAKIS